LLLSAPNSVEVVDHVLDNAKNVFNLYEVDALLSPIFNKNYS